MSSSCRCSSTHGLFLTSAQEWYERSLENSNSSSSDAVVVVTNSRLVMFLYILYVSSSQRLVLILHIKMVTIEKKILYIYSYLLLMNKWKRFDWDDYIIAMYSESLCPYTLWD